MLRRELNNQEVPDGDSRRVLVEGEGEANSSEWHGSVQNGQSKGALSDQEGSSGHDGANS